MLNKLPQFQVNNQNKHTKIKIIQKCDKFTKNKARCSRESNHLSSLLETAKTVCSHQNAIAKIPGVVSAIPSNNRKKIRTSALFVTATTEC